MPPSRSTQSSTMLGTHYSSFTGEKVGTPVFGETAREEKIFWFGKEGHYGYPNFPPARDVGGPFRLTSQSVSRGIMQVGEIWPGSPNPNSLHYSGGFMVNADYTGGWGDLPPDAWGPEAFAKMKPTKPSFAGLNALYELRELPMMIRQRFQSIKDIPSYWLALQFGWKPLLRDTVSMLDLQRSAQKRLAQLLRDNGKPVRRRISLNDSSTVHSSVDSFNNYGALSPVLVTQFYRKGPTQTKTITQTERVWASAQFRYWLPSGPRDINWTRNMLARIYGLHPSPSVVYNAIPWSWLIDWFTTVGDAIANLEAGVADRLAADYFYVMKEQEWHVAYTATGYFADRRGEPVDGTGTSHFRAISKYRTPGDPFGFYTDENSLSGMQLSILGALGLSRLR